VDLRLAQIESFMTWPTPVDTQLGELPQSEILRREVFRKELGGKLMVMKFLTWKTNKENFGYPAYVVSYVNFSSERADPLQTDVRISSSPEQIMELYEELKAKNLKKGWVQVTA
jgi:hypothetical protein